MTKTKTSRNYQTRQNATASRSTATWTNPGGGYEPCLEAGARAYRALIKDWSAVPT